VEGTGLGLTISSQLATLLSGSLVLAQSDPKGSVFELFVPAEALPDDDKVPQWQSVNFQDPQEGGLAELVGQVLDPNYLDSQASRTLSVAGDEVRLEDGDDEKIFRGTYFTWKFHSSLEAPPDTKSLDLASKGERQVKILLAEDNPINGKIISLSLAKYGYAVRWVQDGHDVVDAFKAERFDVVLMDLQMPGLNGIEASREVRKYEQEHSLAETPIVALTARTQSDELNSELKGLMTDYLVKPVPANELVIKLRQLTEGSSNE
jgi:CheY-like chemotaxis protein